MEKVILGYSRGHRRFPIETLQQSKRDTDIAGMGYDQCRIAGHIAEKTAHCG
jgi:hypothetical protein